MYRRKGEEHKKQMKHKKILKKMAVVCLAILSAFLVCSSGGMKSVKAAEEEIGRNSIDAYGGTFGEIVTMEMVAYDDSRDVGTYRFRYYNFHHGDSYTYQAVAVGLYLDGVHKATYSDKVGIGNKFSNDTRLFGTADIQVTAGKTHHVRLQDMESGAMTQVSIDKDIYIPYPSYPVTYKDYNGQILKTQNVQKYNNASPPVNPTRTGYTFTGWSTNSNNITGARTISAQYQINYYTVRYLDYNNTVLKTQSVPYTSNAYPPSNPTRVGYTFTGWNNNGTNITANRDITAQYKINNYNVSFNSMGGSAISTQSVTYQTKVAKPANPSKSNYKFMGWYTDATFQTAYNFNTLIGANNFTLYAKWDAYPVINAANITIHDKQYSFDDWQKLKLKGVTSSDKEDGNMTSKIKITKDSVNLNVPGSYAINYQVTDSVGSTVNKEMKVTVLFNNPPTIEYKNYEFFEDEITQEDWEEDYLMDAVTATDIEDGNMTSKVKVKSDNVDPATPGDYQVVYTVTDQYNKTTEVNAQVKIKYNFAPLITASNRKYMQHEYSNKEWKDHVLDGVEAIDVEDGNITDKIEVIEDDVDMETVGFYRVNYHVVDAYGKQHTKSIQVEIILNVPPIIKAGNKSYYEGELTEETLLKELAKNVTAFDSEDGDITNKVEIIKNNVKPDTAGSYEVTYKVVDSGGKEMMKTIDVTIKNNHKPKLEIFADHKRFVEGQYTKEEWIETIRMQNVTATDIEDHDLTAGIKVIADSVKLDHHGIYSVMYKVTDQYGKSTTKTIKVTVEENLAPVIHASERWFDTEDTISDKVLLKNVIAYDDLDGEISNKVTVKTSTIKEHTAGDYTVTYAVKDSLGAVTTLVTSVHVKNTAGLPTVPVDPPTPPTDEDAVIFADGRKYGTVKLSKFLEASELQDPDYNSVVFGIYAADDIKWQDKVVLYKDSLVDIIRLDDKKGIGTVHQAGYYYVQEINVDDQYVMSDTKYYFEFRY